MINIVVINDCTNEWSTLINILMIMHDKNDHQLSSGETFCHFCLENCGTSSFHPMVSTGWSSFTGWDGMRWPYLRDFPPFTHLAGHHWWGINRPDQPCSCWLCSKSSMTFGGWGRLTSYALMVRDTIYNVVHFWGKSHRSTRSRNAAKLLESQWSKNRNGWSCEISPKAPCLLWHLTSDSSFLAQKISAIWQLDHNWFNKNHLVASLKYCKSM